MSGAVECSVHESGNRLSTLAGKYITGDVLGMIEIDGGRTSQLQSWNLCISAVEVIWMSRDAFMALWDLQDQSPAMITYNVLRM
jgi:hypothetical protein